MRSRSQREAIMLLFSHVYSARQCGQITQWGKCNIRISVECFARLSAQSAWSKSPRWIETATTTNKIRALSDECYAKTVSEKRNTVRLDSALVAVTILTFLLTYVWDSSESHPSPYLTKTHQAGLQLRARNTTATMIRDINILPKMNIFNPYRQIPRRNTSPHVSFSTRFQSHPHILPTQP